MSGAKRAPSSSVKKATCIGSARDRRRAAPASRPPPARRARRGCRRSGRRCARCRCASRSSPAAASGSLPARVATTLPIASIVTSRPRSRIHDTTRSRPCAVGVGQRQPGAAALAVRAVRPRRSRRAPRAAATAGRRRCAGRATSAHRSPSAEVERRRSRAAPSQNAVHRALEQLRAALGGGRGRVADVAVGVEVVRQPAEADPATEAHVACCRRAARGRAARPCSCRRARGRGAASATSRRCRRGRPCRARSAGDVPPWSGGTPGWARNVISPCLQPQLAVGHAEQRAVAAVAVEERRAACAGVVATQRPMSSSTASSVVGRQPDRAGRPGVLVRLGVRSGGSSHTSSSSPTSADRRLGDRVGDHRVGAQRQVRAVLLDRARAAGRRCCAR